MTWYNVADAHSFMSPLSVFGICSRKYRDKKPLNRSVCRSIARRRRLFSFLLGCQIVKKPLDHTLILFIASRVPIACLMPKLPVLNVELNFREDRVIWGQLSNLLDTFLSYADVAQWENNLKIKMFYHFHTLLVQNNRKSDGKTT